MKRFFTKETAPVLVCIILILALMLLPTGYEGAVQYQEAERCVAEVMTVDNSSIVDTGLVRSGEQRCTLHFTNGAFDGETAVGVNMLQGSLEQDKLFEPGDKAQVVISHSGDVITHVTMIDHYRISGELVLGALFVVFLVLFAGKTGLRAIFSFALTVLSIWKLMIPLYLKGYNPIWVGLAVVVLLTTFIIALVYGFVCPGRFAGFSGSFVKMG